MRHFFISPLLLLFLATTAPAWESITLGTADTQDSAASRTTNLFLTECFLRLDFKPTILVRPSKRSIVEADEGHVDGDFARTEAVAERYPNLVKVPEHIGQEILAAFTAEPGLKVDGWSSLADLHVTWVAGREICNRRLGCAARKTLEKDETALLRFISAGRADAGILGRDRGCELIRLLSITNVQPVDPPLEVVKLYLYLHKKHEPLVPKVAAMLRGLKSDGTFEAIWRHFHEGGPYPEGLLTEADDI